MSMCVCECVCVWGGGEGSTSGSESGQDLELTIFIHSTVNYVGGDFTKGLENVSVCYCAILTLLSAPLSVGANRSLTLRNLNGF